ncbi:UDP-N-acetylmuramoylalanyl-D-glutamate--2,6-diaminopimelate ligase [Bacillus toyonensis]|uniref:UDP-N-acetylmuramoylalanyl-D-glutamate--2, 6-diaminopimelate ligase n=1 Tax=Bacillus cereus TaxID=1396 RepID=A0A9X6VPJ6_BACCE|nr:MULTISPECIES: UDP-N-acetylmuramoylalanyl-D-glutamate--2,6-diaminopimelate ligase [Bacillus]HDR6316345.1 UDP-N-acetylmuramoylalanyl-D-glutamate--2,6-diaminopimelate ligase [Bacillus thuringiensis]MBJ8127110.1 UDP-N-acetylmuramoylalanyl-D-glutamate--2,6-diaminopimelate ligase [Bacillus cereus]MBY7128721.1 UDP-N-acetylmuramoylalanyl-D-glutamate--2,6-diaminopimelate ligase [Bacillus sp. 8YEL33]MCH5454536.1 UDP-N-acetylmuramoylalanyl-D-glutamate--2,6-diaminopimelate ligase [Bacillus toyonensis]M
MWIKKMLFNYRVKPSLLKSRYEIEKENRQVDLFESSTETSKPVSIRDTRSYIQPNTKTLEDVINYLAAIHEIPSLSVDKNKMLWPLISKC